MFRIVDLVTVGEAQENGCIGNPGLESMGAWKPLGFSLGRKSIEYSIFISLKYTQS